jgi:hypothetical protein
MPQAVQHPRSVFVSYSTEDTYFVDLLVKLLTFHRIRPWHDSHEIAAARDIPDTLREGLRTTESMIVVLSPHALQSRWVSKELFAFTTLRGTNAVYPVKLKDFQDTEGVFQELRDRKAIDFSGNMLDGFQQLTEAFGKPFLPLPENRRAASDRRTCPIAERLEFDFQRIVERFPSVGRPESLTREQRGVLFVDFVEALHARLVERYRLIDRRTGAEVHLPTTVFEQVVLGSYAGFDALEQRVPDFFIGAVVQRLAQLFRIEARSRRVAAQIL